MGLLLPGLFDTPDLAVAVPALLPMPGVSLPAGPLAMAGLHVAVLPLQTKQACGLQPLIEPSVLRLHAHPAVRAQASITFFIEAACAGVEIVPASNSVAVKARAVMQASRAGLRKRSVIMAVSRIRLVARPAAGDEIGVPSLMCLA